MCWFEAPEKDAADNSLYDVTNVVGFTSSNFLYFSFSFFLLLSTMNLSWRYGLSRCVAFVFQYIISATYDGFYVVWFVFYVLRRQKLIYFSFERCMLKIALMAWKFVILLFSASKSKQNSSHVVIIALCSPFEKVSCVFQMKTKWMWSSEHEQTRNFVKEIPIITVACSMSWFVWVVMIFSLNTIQNPCHMMQLVICIDGAKESDIVENIQDYIVLLPVNLSIECVENTTKVGINTKITFTKHRTNVIV